jgi:hypothetical protein
MGHTKGPFYCLFNFDIYIQSYITKNILWSVLEIQYKQEVPLYL